MEEIWAISSSRAVISFFFFGSPQTSKIPGPIHSNAVVLSIHQNHFSDSRYSGPQVFYTDGGEDLAKTAQEALTAVLAPGSRRASKPASGVYLMEHIDHPGILVECGFLSNPDEERRLATSAPQKKIAATLAAVVAGFVYSGI